METLYFSWERSPAVITGKENARFGYFIPVMEPAVGWREATPDVVKDFFIDGSRLSKSEFENMFGVIGDNLPDLPEKT